MKNDRVFAVVAVLVLIGLFVWGANHFKKEETQATQTPAVDVNELTRAHTFTKGPFEASVTIVEFLDPECEACRAMHPIIQQIFNEYSGKVRIAYRYMPFHGNSMYAASVLEEAREQGKFEEALTLLFDKQPEWGSHHEPKPELIPEYLKTIGIKPETLDRAKVIGKHGSKIEIDHMDGMKFGVTGTPTFFVNGKKLPNIGYEPLKLAVEQALSQAK